MKKVVVMGQGSVGLPLAMAAAEAGHDVVGYEPDKERLSQLSANRSCMSLVPDDLVAKHTDSRAYMATSYFPALRGFDIAVITTPTPPGDYEAALVYAYDAARDLALALSEGGLIILTSDTLPGTTRDVIVPVLEELSAFTAGEHFHVAYSNRTAVAGLTMACRQLAALFLQQTTGQSELAETLEDAESAMQ